MPLSHDTDHLTQDDEMPMAEGGFGIHITKVVMDEVSYRHDPERGNLLEMRKYL